LVDAVDAVFIHTRLHCAPSPRSIATIVYMKLNLLNKCSTMTHHNILSSVEKC